MTDTRLRDANGAARAVPLIIAAGIGAAVAAAAVLSWPSGHRDTLPPPVAPLPGLEHRGDLVVVPEHSSFRQALRVVPVESVGLGLVHQLPANVEADPADVVNVFVNVLPPLGGRVIAVETTIGAHVHRGQVLVRIESGDMAQARADVDKSAAQLDLTRLALKRAQGLNQIGGGAVKDAQSARNDYEQALAENTRATVRMQSLLGNARLGPKGLVITAPIDGVVTTLSVAPGSYINDTTQALMVINGGSHVLVTALAAEDDIAFISPGKAADVTVGAWPDASWAANVSSIDTVTQSDTRRTKVRIRVDNPDGRLRPGMFATVSPGA